MKKLHLLCAACACLLFTTPALAASVLSWTDGRDAVNSTGIYVYGWAFNVESAITIDQLGLYDSGQDGLAESHEIGIWDAAGTLLTSTAIPSGTSAVLDGVNRMIAIPELTLEIGSGYVIGVNNLDVDMMIVAASSVSTDPSISYVGGRFMNTGGMLAMPAMTSTTATYFGPNFSIATASIPPVPAAIIPIPPALWLFGSGLLGLVGIARRKKVA